MMRFGFCLRNVAATLCVCAIVGCPVVTPGTPVSEGPQIVGGLAPGLSVTIESVQVPIDLRPEVKFTATDENGNTLALSELTDARFVLAFLEQQPGWPTSRFTSYTTNNSGQATQDSARLNGVTQNEDGSFMYKFATALPASFNRNENHQIAAQVRRDFGGNGMNYRANPVFRFKPNGAAVTGGRDVVETATCNECHTRLSVHGDVRREVQYCIVCHNRQSFDPDTGNSVDFPEMIHKIHMGANLPSWDGGDAVNATPYQIIGFGGSVHDYSHVVFPQDIQNCSVCHKDADKDIDENFHLQNASLAGCASCHDRTWFGLSADRPDGWEQHPFENVDEGSCQTCHAPNPSKQNTFPIDIARSHLSDAEEFGLGLALNVVGVSFAPTTSTGLTNPVALTIEFTATDRNGAAITNFDGMSINATVAWPAPEYEMWHRESATSAAFNAGTNTWSYTFESAFEGASTDTYAVAMGGRRPIPEAGGNEGTSTNGQLFFAFDGSKGITPRREVVADSKCNVCHGDLHAHGENRVGVNYCVMCHNVFQTDEPVRPGENMPPVTVNFKDMIHGIHMGEDLNQDLTIFGFRSSVHNFNDVVFPGRKEECAMCHVDDSFGVPTPTETLPTTVIQELNGPTVISTTYPQAAACTSCHDSPLAVLHTVLNTDANGQESCAVCHGSGKEFDVEVIHALGP